jgi:hypothetical protein
MTLSALALMMAFVACAPTGSVTPTPDASGTPAGTSAAPSSTAVSSTPRATLTAPGATASAEPNDEDASPPVEVTQTDTEWGRIWDGVPAGFPRYPGAQMADDAGPDPVSASYAIASGDAAEIATWMQTAMETATYSTEALSGPLEDGSWILDSVGDGACRIETKIAPLGGLILVTVHYGAACPLS